ncbi:MAG: hypothetical protein WD645_00045 [Dehalococcoidia bacterium]
MVTMELRRALEAAPWRWAKSYAKTAPHWYIVRHQVPDLFNAMVDLVRAEGVSRRWKDGRTYRYLDLDGWKYWHVTGVLNREPLPGTPRPDVEEGP